MIPFIALASVGEGMCKLLSAILHAGFTEVKSLNSLTSRCWPYKSNFLTFLLFLILNTGTTQGQHCNNILCKAIKELQRQHTNPLIPLLWKNNLSTAPSPSRNINKKYFHGRRQAT